VIRALLLIAFLATDLAGSGAWAQSSKSIKTPPPAQNEINDVEEPPGEGPAYAAPETDEPPPDDDLEYGKDYPDQTDSDIEFAEEAEQRELEAKKKKAEEQKRLLTQPKTKPPVEEPMPLIRRKRQFVEYPERPVTKKYIRHPYASKGLTKITRDKTYIYRVPRTKQSAAATLAFGVFNPYRLKNPNTGNTFNEYYSNNNAAVIFDYEWQIWRKFGKLAVKLGTGISFASGSGEFKNNATTGNTEEPLEKFTFIVAPTSLGAVYRFQYWDRQIIVPFGEGGGTAFTFGEFRDDNKRPKFGGALGAYFGAGAAFNMNFMDTVSMLEIDREYGINDIFLVAEYRAYVGFGKYDFTNTFINAGFLFEF
jgi:hypothetical protein